MQQIQAPVEGVFTGQATASPRRVLARLLLALVLVAVVLPVGTPSVVAATVPAGFIEENLTASCTYPNCLARPTAMALSPDGAIYVAEQGGRLRVLRNDVLLAAPFIDLSPVNDGSNERGLIGVVVDPQFVSNPARRFVYVYYTVKAPQGGKAHNRVSRFTAQANGNLAVAGSETILMELEDLNAGNHNGGAMHFASDGRLFIAVGENAVTANAQSLDNRLGKVLRINADGTIPTDNPFYGVASGVNRSIWALGLRNPFTFAIQAGTDRLFINDVGSYGANVHEEINEGVAGANYGWPIVEGIAATPPYRDPRYAYPHSGGPVSGCAITGGAFYNPATVQFPAEYVGDYFFGDYCGDWIKRLDLATNTVIDFASGLDALVDLRVAADGSLYILARNGGTIPGSVTRVRYAGANQAPSITSQPEDATVGVGQGATFAVTASGVPAPAYQWQRNGVAIGGATAASYTLPSVDAADNGARFRVVVSNSAGEITSREATLTVPSNRPPIATITGPAVGAFYSAGETIDFAGTATDPDEGALPASAFTWQIDLHHAAHTHPALPPTSGVASGQYGIPTTGHTETNVFYRVTLTVRDGGGLTHAVTRDVQPRLARMTIASQPAGLNLTLDGQPFTAPQSVTGVVGIERTLGAPSLQSAGGRTYSFATWSDGGAASHSVSTPATDTTYTATYRMATGLVFRDANRSGVRESNEAGLPDATVFVDANGNGQRDAGEASGPSDASGVYGLALPAGAHRLCLDLPDDLISTTPRCSWLAVAGDGPATALDFGLTQPRSCPLGAVQATVRSIALAGSATYLPPTQLSRSSTTGAWPGTRLAVQPWTTNPAASVQYDEHVAYALTLSGLRASDVPDLVLRVGYGKGRQAIVDVVASDGTVASPAGSDYSLPNPLPAGFSAFDKNGDLHLFNLPVDASGAYQDLVIHVRVLATGGTTTVTAAAAGKVINGRLTSIGGFCSDTARTAVFTGPTAPLTDAMPLDDVAGYPF